MPAVYNFVIIKVTWIQFEILGSVKKVPATAVTHKTLVSYIGIYGY